MKYYLSADGGGTKLLSALFDEDCRLCGVGRGGSVNANFETVEKVRRNMETSVEQCLKSYGPLELACVSVSGPLPTELYEDVVSERAKILRWEVVDEGRMSLYAGAFSERGIVAQAGTGSDVFNIDGDAVTTIGGWGGLVDDEGSGYDIGRAGISAAIKAYDTRGPKTALTELIMKKFDLMRLKDIIPMVYVSNYRKVIADVCPLVAAAAEQGDAVAAKILKSAGEKLAEQVVAIKLRDRVPDDRVVMVSGSVWKGNAVMYGSFRDAVHKRFPDTKVVRPLFVPVVGGVVRYAIGCGEWNENLKTFLKNEYAAFLYDEGDSTCLTSIFRE